jgi:hypothetical protein
MHKLARFAREFVADIRREKYDVTQDGILVKGSAVIRGWYDEGLVGQPETWRRHQNLLPAEGILKVLGLAFFTDAKINTWYLAPFAANVPIVPTLTAASFPATQSEIVSSAEGYTEAARQTWTPAAPAAGKISNTATKAQFTIITASQLTVWGAGLLSASAKGAVSGTLASATKYNTSRVLNNADVWGCGYEIELTDV